jgi:cytochrome b
MRTIKVWDLFVRVFHWLLIIAIVTQMITAESAKGIHATVGYFIVALVFLRIIWGVIGSKHARFTDFIYPPADVLSYLKGLFRGQPGHYLGHNPAGGAMVCLLLFVLVLTTMTGLLTYGAEGKGPFATHPTRFVKEAVASDQGVSSGDEHAKPSERDGGHFWKEIHETLVGILLFLAGLHVCGVIVSSYIHKENLILAMVTGNKKVK